jgi:hypothetical protein
MTYPFKTLGEGLRRSVLVEAALRGARAHGMVLARKPGRGKASIWEWKREDGPRLVAIRTGQSRAFTFPPLEHGEKWRTLDDVDYVLVAVVDDRDHPQAVEVYLFDQPEVRRRFELNYRSRTEAGQSVTDDYGAWLPLDRDDRDLPHSAGSGLADDFPPIASFSLQELIKEPVTDHGNWPAPNSLRERMGRHATEPETVGETISWARNHIAKLASVPVDAVSLDLKIHY